MTFRRKLILAFLVCILFPVLILGYMSYKISTDTLQKNISEQNVQTLYALDKNIMGAVQEVNHFSDYVISSGDVHSFLESKEKETILDLYDRQQAIAGMMYGNAGVQQFILFNMKGERLYQSNDQFFWEEPGFLVEEMKERKGKAVWLSPSTITKHPFGEKQEAVFTQGRVINDVNTLNPLGYMILNVRLEQFDDVFKNTSETPSKEMLINREGDVLYAPDHEWIGKKLDLPFLKELRSGEKGYLLKQWGGETNLITYLPSSFKLDGQDIWMVSLRPWEVLSNDIKYIRNITFALSGVVIVGAMFFNWFYLRRVASFIHSLQYNMKKAESGDLTARMNEHALKELRHLSFRFNQMIRRIGELIQQIRDEEEKSRQAEFKVLQQQINPHFLYNTLESINAMAASSGQRDISLVTINLGRLLRISINGSYEVRVSQEISHVISYLEIQKIRFDHLFSYSVEVDPELEKRQVLKLILQPLVENILSHAFVHEGEGMISIHGEVKGDTGYFWVKDNGRGFSTEALLKLQRKREEKEERGHGITNVQERLKLFYGDSYGLMVCSFEKGTIIRISFPLKKGENNHV